MGENVEPDGRSAPVAPPLLADEMLGRLARTLRLLGYDTEYAKDVEDDDVLRRLAAPADAAPTGDRVLLTRDVRLAERARRAGHRVVLLSTLAHEEQAREVLAALTLRPDPQLVLTRCAVCNAVLRAATPEEAAAAPPGARPPHRTCPGCGRLYWEGSHAPKVRAMADRLGMP